MGHADFPVSGGRTSRAVVNIRILAFLARHEPV